MFFFLNFTLYFYFYFFCFLFFFHGGKSQRLHQERKGMVFVTFCSGQGELWLL